MKSVHANSAVGVSGQEAASKQDGVPGGAEGGQIPVLDLGPLRAGEPGAAQALGRELRHALEHVGFYFIKNHGVEPGLIDEAFAAARRFFAQPLDEKLGLRFNDHNIGYVPSQGSVTRHSELAGKSKPNIVESFFLKRDLPADHPDVLANKPFRGMNQWPADLPGFREPIVAYMEEMERLGKLLVPLYALALDLPDDWFDEAFKEPMYTLRISHYPQQQVVEADTFGLAPHTDTSFMTLLPQNKVKGLSIRFPDGRWADVPPIPGTYLINSGDMLRRWSNDRFLSTPHRVINTSGEERYAIPFFMDCSYDWVMKCIPTCASESKPPAYEPFTYPDYISWYRNKNYSAVISKEGDKA